MSFLHQCLPKTTSAKKRDAEKPAGPKTTNWLFLPRRAAFARGEQPDFQASFLLFIGVHRYSSVANSFLFFGSQGSVLANEHQWAKRMLAAFAGRVPSGRLSAPTLKNSHAEARRTRRKRGSRRETGFVPAAEFHAIPQCLSPRLRVKIILPSKATRQELSHDR